MKERQGNTGLVCGLFISNYQFCRAVLQVFHKTNLDELSLLLLGSFRRLLQLYNYKGTQCIEALIGY